MEDSKLQPIASLESLFTHSFIDEEVYYFYRFGQIPSNKYYVQEIDRAVVVQHLKNTCADLIVQSFYNYDYESKKGRYEVEYALFELTNQTVVKVNYRSVTILTTVAQENWACDLGKKLSKFKRKNRTSPFEINLIVQEMNSLDLREIKINRTKINLGLFYEDDFLNIHKIIKQRLSKQNDKGLVLLHGLPGTGKTTYIRYLIGQINKKVLFLTPNLAEQITNPDFINLLINNPNSVLVVEDAENILLDRNQGGGSGVSNLLNLSDGLLADCLNVQIICTFNSSLAKIDEALLRKGRLIAKYEFKALSVEKSQQLSAHFGHDTFINKPMTIAEIVNQKELDFKTAQKQSIGF